MKQLHASVASDAVAMLCLRWHAIVLFFLLFVNKHLGGSVASDAIATLRHFAPDALKPAKGPKPKAAQPELAAT